MGTMQCVHIEQAVEILARGELVAFPTETVYGLGADASSAEALERLFQTKGRPTNHPVIVHLGEVEWLADWADSNEAAQRLIESFWPGPLTLILPRKAGVSDLITGGQSTVGVRMPDHPVALDLLRRFGRALVAPSANRFGRVSPTTAEHVMSEFSVREAHVLDGGPCQVGVESTIVDLSGLSPVVLRPGQITSAEIFEALGESHQSGRSSVRAPGGLSSHYAPTRRTVKLNTSEIDSKTTEFIEQGLKVAGFTAISDDRFHRWVAAPDEAESYARSLYATLRLLDESGADVILVEEPPYGSSWEAIHDRLNRATYRP